MTAELQLFPALDPATDAALRASIERFGVIVPVAIDQNGRVLDGHHRRRIAGELGLYCPSVECHVRDEDEAAEIARTLNMDRRHLSAEQRREIVAQLRSEGHSTRAIGGALGISHVQVQNDLAGSGGNDLPPGTVRGQDGKHYPSTRPARDIEPGDVVEDDSGEARTVSDVQHHDAEVVLFDEDGDALILGDDHDVSSKPPSKPDLGGGISHPARYPKELIPLLAVCLEGASPVLDPFAGSGRIHELQGWGYKTIGVEIEPEWAQLHPDTIVGNALELPFDDASLPAVCTSPTYGNRLADSHDARDDSVRRTYTHDLGRKLSPDNSGALQWGHHYRAFHEKAWREVSRVLSPGGRFVLNIKDHIRGGRRQYVAGWHVTMLCRMGFELLYVLEIPTGGLTATSNGDLRVGAEQVFVLERSRGGES